MVKNGWEGAEGPTLMEKISFCGLKLQECIEFKRKSEAVLTLNLRGNQGVYRMFKVIEV